MYLGIDLVDVGPLNKLSKTANSKHAQVRPPEAFQARLLVFHMKQAHSSIKSIKSMQQALGASHGHTTTSEHRQRTQKTDDRAENPTLLSL